MKRPEMMDIICRKVIPYLVWNPVNLIEKDNLNWKDLYYLF
ncbi:MAG: hypothetical protein UR28_C0011G0024 [Candidatus Peregrinibacteria bacterium GW2011_GWF2_33_10]|nr:MAG: hypothetical protein UR28_C0011G0024 [Candidatus Peregrinibacteria bacterium GW2011_GWF2_33_10]